MVAGGAALLAPDAAQFGTHDALVAVVDLVAHVRRSRLAHVAAEVALGRPRPAPTPLRPRSQPERHPAGGSRTRTCTHCTLRTRTALQRRARRGLRADRNCGGRLTSRQQSLPRRRRRGQLRHVQHRAAQTPRHVSSATAKRPVLRARRRPDASNTAARSITTAAERQTCGELKQLLVLWRELWSEQQRRRRLRQLFCSRRTALLRVLRHVMPLLAAHCVQRAHRRRLLVECLGPR